MERMNSVYLHSAPLLPTAEPQRTARQKNKTTSFASILERAQGKVAFSQHALGRMEEGGVHFSPEDLHRLDDAVERMSAKGARESLIYLNHVALVVSVRNRTVITAVDGARAKDNIFTNIDSAAIL